MHNAGYVRVNGFYQTSPYAPYTVLGDSEGSPELPEVVAFLNRTSSIGSTFSLDQPAWLIASAYTGKRFARLLATLLVGNQ